MTSTAGATVDDDLDVVVIGAGLSGVAAGHYLRKDCPWATFTILESRGSLGGTWSLFEYPGLRSDSDMFTLGYSFRPWDGPKSIADGNDILDYIERTAHSEGIDRHIQYRRRVTAANWSSTDRRWHLTVDHLDDGSTSTIRCKFVMSCTGYYRYDHGYTPEFDGVADFSGHIIHPQHWPTDIDVAGQRVTVIGSGATAITLVPALARTAAHVTMLQRSPTYVVAAPSTDRVINALRRRFPGRATATAIRWWKTLVSTATYLFARQFPKAAARAILSQVVKSLPDGYDVDRHFRPRYAPWDQRICLAADGDFFDAIRSGSASIVTDHVDHFTEHGIALRSGDHLDSDLVVTATGLELLFLGGILLSVDGAEVAAAERLLHRGAMLAGVPNFAIALGYTNASWTLRCELTCRYITQLLGHMRTHRLDVCTPQEPPAHIRSAPALGLSSGYVQRAVGSFPPQGTRDPWKTYDTYLRDLWSIRAATFDNDDLHFGLSRRPPGSNDPGPRL
ncbi:MAG: flavin-containing monooxygenase [Actinomycetes bacterium]